LCGIIITGGPPPSSMRRPQRLLVDRSTGPRSSVAPRSRHHVLDQRLRRRRVGGLEVAEEADAVAVELVVQPVAAHADAADAVGAAPRREEADLGVGEERVLARIELPGLGERHRRHVVRVAFVEAALQVEETPRRALAADGDRGARLCCGGGHPVRG
jgi:hypothetical protein